MLRSLRDKYDISCHGVGLSLGSCSPVNRGHLSKLKSLVDDIDPLFVSDHLSWSEHDGHYFNDLLPLPYTEESLHVFCRNVLTVQEYLGQAILVENPSSYVRFEHSTIPEWEFLSHVQKMTGCHLLLDFNNIHVSAFNHGFNPEKYLDSIAPEAVKEIHLAGFSRKITNMGEIWIDTHSAMVSDEVWSLYSKWISEHGNRHTLIEWDLDLPAPQVLLLEAEKSSQLLYANEVPQVRAVS